MPDGADLLPRDTGFKHSDLEKLTRKKLGSGVVCGTMTGSLPSEDPRKSFAMSAGLT